MANWQHCPAVERANEQNGGLWMFKGRSVPLYALYETLASGATVDDFAARHGLTVEQASGGASVRSRRTARLPAGLSRRCAPDAQPGEPAGRAR